MTFKIATASYSVKWRNSFSQWQGELEQWVIDASKNNAQLLVFPEYAFMDLASLWGKDVCGDLTLQIEKLQTIKDDVFKTFEDLAKKYNVWIVAGTYPVTQENGKVVNTAWVFSNNGYEGDQDKQMMTRFEDEQWCIESGGKLRVFETPFCKFGIITCFDSEFPMFARKLIEMGADILICPSCTSSQAGYNRVKIGCQARAMEQCCYVIHSPLVGNAEWIESVDINVGSAAVYAPCDKGMPSDGIVAIGEMNNEQWVYADLDLKLLDNIRRDGQVFNYKLWNQHLKKAEEE